VSGNILVGCTSLLSYVNDVHLHFAEFAVKVPNDTHSSHEGNNMGTIESPDTFVTYVLLQLYGKAPQLSRSDLLNVQWLCTAYHRTMVLVSMNGRN